MSNAALIMNSFDTETTTTTTNAAQPAAPTVMDTNEHELATSCAVTPSGTSDINRVSTHDETKVETLQGETDQTSESVDFNVTAELHSEMGSLFYTDYDADCFFEELEEVFPVDLPGCQNMDCVPDCSVWSIKIPLCISFSMPKGVADLLCDEDIRDRLEAELKRLAAKIPMLPLPENGCACLLHNLVGVRITDTRRQPAERAKDPILWISQGAGYHEEDYATSACFS